MRWPEEEASIAGVREPEILEFHPFYAITRFAFSNPLPIVNSFMNDRLFRPLFAALILSSLGSLAMAATSPSSLETLRANADKGNAIAQYNLGLILADPNEPAYDLVEAFVWLSRAAAGGSRSRDLNRVTDLLTPAQLRAAQAQLAPAPTVSITPLDDEDFGPATPAARPTPVVTSADPELRKRLAIAESALAVRERDLAKLRQELEAQGQAKPNPLDGSPNAAAEIEFLRSQLAASTSDVMALREELSGLRSSQANAQQSRDDLATQLSQTQNELATLRAQSATVSSLQAELTEARNKLAEQNSAGPELVAAQSKIQGLNEEVANSWKTQGRLQSQIAESKQAYDNAQAELKSLKLALDARAQNLTTAHAQLEELRTQLAAASATPTIDPVATERVQVLEAQLAQTRQAHATTQAELAHLAQTRDSQSEDLANARARIEQLQLVAAEQRASLEAEVAQLRAELANVPPPPVENSADPKRIANLESQLEASTQSRAQLERTLTQAQAQLRETAAELAASRANLAKANTPSAPPTDSAELNLVREQLAAVAAQRNELQAVLAQRNGASQTQVTALENELKAVRTELQNQTTAAERLRDQLATAAVETEVLRAAQSEIDQLHEELAAAQQAAAERIEPAPTPTVAADTSANQEKLATSLRAFAAVEAQLRTSRQKLEEAEKDAEVDAAKIAALESQLADLRPALATAQIAAENAQSEASDTTLALAETRAQLASTQADLDRISREFATFRESSADQFRVAEILAAKNADLSTQVRQTKEQYAEASREVADLRTRYALSVSNAVASSSNVRATPVRPTPAVNNGVRTHTVISGDSLSRIAEQYLGNPDRWPEIYAANRDTLSATNGVRTGMVLLIP